MQPEYTTGISGGITKNHRALLDLLNRKHPSPFTVSDASKTLNLSIKKTSRLLPYLASQGWLTRIRRGLYSTVPLGATNPAERKEEPFIVATTLFEPCYMGGWSACEHWGLTDQIFKDIVVYSSRKVRGRKQTIQGTTYIIKSVSEDKLFGTNVVWQQQTKSRFSDPSRTLVDILDDPSIGGGIRHVADVTAEYFESEYREDDKLFEYIERLDNRTVYKRLGYIIETLELNLTKLEEICKRNISKGYSLLDPSAPKDGAIIRRWNLRLNAKIG